MSLHNGNAQGLAQEAIGIFKCQGWATKFFFPRALDGNVLREVAAGGGAEAGEVDAANAPPCLAAALAGRLRELEEAVGSCASQHSTRARLFDKGRDILEGKRRLRVIILSRLAFES